VAVAVAVGRDVGGAVGLGVAPVHAPSSRHQLSVLGFHGAGGQSRVAEIAPTAVYFLPPNVTAVSRAYAVHVWNAGKPRHDPPEVVGVAVGREVAVAVAVDVDVAVAGTRGVEVGVPVARGVAVGVGVAVPPSQGSP
jgi:hypothetical protein